MSKTRKLAIELKNRTNTDNASCLYEGCTDNMYLEYYTQGFVANIDNGSCQTMAVFGCMLEDFANYNSLANINDTLSCLYDAGCVTGAGTPYWLNDPCYAWVLSVDDYCCENAWDTICQATYDYCDGTWSGPLLTRTEAEKKLIMITDLLGRPAKENTNELLFYIYSDGTVKRKLIKE